MEVMITTTMQSNIVVDNEQTIDIIFISIVVASCILSIILLFLIYCGYRVYKMKNKRTKDIELVNTDNTTNTNKVIVDDKDEVNNEDNSIEEMYNRKDTETPNTKGEE